MAAPEQIDVLVDYCISKGFKRVRIEGRTRELNTFFTKEQIENYLIERVRSLVPSLFEDNHSEIETLSLAKVFNDLSEQIGYDELQRRITERLNIIFPREAPLIWTRFEASEVTDPIPVLTPYDRNLHEIEAGFRELNLLSQLEYHQSLGEVLEGGDARRVAERLERLVGVLIKQPYADVHYEQSPSSRTSAYRSWELKSASDFEKAAAHHPLLDKIRSELKVEASTYQLAEDAKYESGFFGLYARSIRKYICGDEAIRKKVDDAFKGYTKSKIGGPIKAPTPEALVGVGGLSLGVDLVQAHPIFAVAGAPVIAGVVLILYTLGIDAFCKWIETEGQTADIEKS